MSWDSFSMLYQMNGKTKRFYFVKEIITCPERILLSFCFSLLTKIVYENSDSFQFLMGLHPETFIVSWEYLKSKVHTLHLISWWPPLSTLCGIASSHCVLVGAVTAATTSWERIILQIASLGQNEIQNSKSRSYWKRMASSVPWRWKAVVWNIVSWGPSVLMFVGEGGSRLELKRPPCTQEAHEWNPCFTWPLECVVSRARSDQGHRLHLHQEGIKIPSANRKIQSSDREIGKLPYEGGTNQDELPCLSISC